MAKLRSSLRAKGDNPDGAGEGGFSLLEIAIVLVILGILGSVVLPGFLAHQQNKKNQITREHQERIFYALAVYLQNYGHLPCPADPLEQGSAQGIQRESCFRPINLAQGLLPFRTLGLSEAFAKDGYRRFFTYAVHPNLTSIRLLSFCGQNIDKELVLMDAGVPVEGQLGLKDRVAIVLVSHGPSSSQKETSSACAQENTNGDLVFCARPAKDQPGIFEDQVRWETRLNFATYYAKIGCVEKK